MACSPLPFRALPLQHDNDAVAPCHPAGQPIRSRAREPRLRGSSGRHLLCPGFLGAVIRVADRDQVAGARPDIRGPRLPPAWVTPELALERWSRRAKRIGGCIRLGGKRVRADQYLQSGRPPAKVEVVRPPEEGWPRYAMAWTVGFAVRRSMAPSRIARCLIPSSRIARCLIPSPNHPVAHRESRSSSRTRLDRRRYRRSMGPWMKRTIRRSRNRQKSPLTCHHLLHPGNGRIALPTEFRQ
jgi:hypothetical protein